MSEDKCALCGRTRGEHKSLTSSCPIGKKRRTLGFLGFHPVNVFTREAAPKVEVFKVQRDMTGGYLLIYNRDASSMQQVPWKQVKNLLGIHGMRPMSKRYVYAEVTPSRIYVTGRAPAQDW